MANEFVRKIRKTDVTKEPLTTNTEGDIILDREKGAYIRYKDKYNHIGSISNLTFNTNQVTLKNTSHDGTKRIELSEDLLNKINNPIQAGVHTIEIKTADTWITESVIFKQDFNSTPTVVLTPSGGGGFEDLHIQLNYVSKGAFAITVKTSSAPGTLTVHWIAVPRT